MLPSFSKGKMLLSNTLSMAIFRLCENACFFIKRRHPWLNHWAASSLFHVSSGEAFFLVKRIRSFWNRVSVFSVIDWMGVPSWLCEAKDVANHAAQDENNSNLSYWQCCRLLIESPALYRCGKMNRGSSFGDAMGMRQKGFDRIPPLKWEVYNVWNCEILHFILMMIGVTPMR